MALREEGFWDQHYEEELKNFDDAGDEGEVWFGRGLSRKITSQIVEMINRDLDDRRSSGVGVLDIGCGNAFLLITLIEKVDREEKHAYANELTLLGLDYSKNSIELSKKIVASKDLSDRISLCQCDFLDSEQLQTTIGGRKFTFVIDVGTYDAICLLASDSDSKMDVAKRAYLASLYRVVDKGTIFVLASCNHTRDELESLFKLESPFKRDIVITGEIETPKLMFGGKQGSQVCCLIIKFQ